NDKRSTIRRECGGEKVAEYSPILRKQLTGRHVEQLNGVSRNQFFSFFDRSEGLAIGGECEKQTPLIQAVRIPFAETWQPADLSPGGCLSQMEEQILILSFRNDLRFELAVWRSLIKGIGQCLLHSPDFRARSHAEFDHDLIYHAILVGEEHLRGRDQDLSIRRK